VRVVALGLVALVLAALHDAVRAEVAAALQALPYGIVRIAARALPRATRARWVDEWMADLDAQRADHEDRPLLLLATALRIVLGIPRLRWHHRAGGNVPAASASGPSPYAIAVETLIERARRNRQYLTSEEIGVVLVHCGVGPEDLDALLLLLHDMTIEIVET